ncbi:MAG: hypothetical protein EXR27_04155 [Betaproteobacteria bacterium]|nr:hypothetical protein [Betaproteobacteria bacterium]
MAVADQARFFNSWLRRIAPDTHQNQASGNEAACRPGGVTAPEERWYRNLSTGFITDLGSSQTGSSQTGSSQMGSSQTGSSQTRGCRHPCRYALTWPWF